MWITRPLAVAALIVSMGLPAMAQPIEIATLGRAPLMGESTNSAELQSNVKHNEALLRRAGMSLGLTNEQYEQFRLAIEVGKPNWVTVPRHLDAMTWASGGQVHVLHDVIIPANQKGVEVDLVSGDRQIALFLPAKCGNLSVIRKPIPHVAQARNFPVPHPPRYTSYQPCAPGMVGTEYPNCTQVAVQSQPAPLVAPALPPAVVPPPIHHGINLLPLAALLPFVIHSSNTTTPGGPPPGTGTIVGPPPCP